MAFDKEEDAYDMQQIERSISKHLCCRLELEKPCGPRSMHKTGLQVWLRRRFSDWNAGYGWNQKMHSSCARLWAGYGSFPYRGFVCETLSNFDDGCNIEDHDRKAVFPQPWRYTFWLAHCLLRYTEVRLHYKLM